ncbi:MAG TPA: short-chain dehydrogenase [Rhodobacteraceae bacterium]|nr:short-chain dehydrogenase [Paracoccaceae bacterium]
MNGLFSLEGKVAVITGASRGIGLAIAQEMARAGARVVLSSRNGADCAARADEINAEIGGEVALGCAASLSDKSALQAMVDLARDRFGQIDVLVCNAASNPHYGPMETLTDEAFRKIMDNNVLANSWLVGMVAPEMRARKDGAIILVSSIGGLTGSRVIGAYNISKAADMQLARNLAVEYGRDNVRVNCIAPGLIRTEFARALWENPDLMRAYDAAVPMARVGEPEEIAGAAMFLAAPAGRFVTGQSIVVDGGATNTGLG